MIRRTSRIDIRLPRMLDQMSLRRCRYIVQSMSFDQTYTQSPLHLALARHIHSSFSPTNEIQCQSLMVNLDSLGVKLQQGNAKICRFYQCAVLRHDSKQIPTYIYSWWN